MSSIREQIVARMATVLTGTLPNAIPVYRSRADAFARNEVPAVVVKPSEDDAQPFTDLQEVVHFNVSLEVIVRGDVWDSLADPIIVAAHALLLNDTALAALCSKLRRSAAKWEDHEADQTAGVLVQGYSLQYLSFTNQL
jgi:hypothetical protein